MSSSNDIGTGEHIKNCSRGSSPRKGQLVALRTKAERNASFEPTKAFIIEIPLQLASRALEAANKVIDASNLHHLRRFVKPEQLPLHLKEASKRMKTGLVGSNEREAIVIAESKFDLVGCESECPKSEVLWNENKQATVYFLLCLESNISFDSALELLAPLHIPSANALQLQLRTINVPRLPPTCDDQASLWSQLFWPTVYKKHNPFGPHPSVVSRAEDEMLTSAGEWMSFAENAGIDVSELGIGEPIGAVIVNRTSPHGPSVVIIAGDARWHSASEKQGSGNVLAHAVMRAIGLIARKRRAMLGNMFQAGSTSETACYFEDQPLTPAEIAAYSRDTLAPGGYLCVGLDIYVTHEPCTMCSMALLHSRFERIIFWEGLPQTGGLAVEPSSSSGSPSYGIFWRPELSWKLLAWQWHSTNRVPSKLSNATVHA
ncbi:tRNA-specific adenosine deaminase subunit tad3 [Pseudocyphellaria aurata]|nr:tRNA-specific adenosine deaminase subunit tad3 [Pseudocyphellaria aurata]